MVRFTANGRSVISRHRVISCARASGEGCVRAVNVPSAPALETAEASSALPTHCMPPCTIGCSMPSICVSRVFIIPPGADARGQGACAAVREHRAFWSVIIDTARESLKRWWNQRGLSMAAAGYAMGAAACAIVAPASPHSPSREIEQVNNDRSTALRPLAAAASHGCTPRLLAWSCAAALSMLATPALQAQPAGQQAEVEEIIVTSNTRRPESLATVNASVGLISQQEIELVSHQHIQEVANRLAGVNINRNNGQESLTSIRSPVLSGSGACGAFLLAEQGIPLRAAGFCNVNELFDANSENASRIEVIRGPATAYYGSNAVHGMINVVLPDPREGGDITLEAGPRGTARVNTTFGMD